MGPLRTYNEDCMMTHFRFYEVGIVLFSVVFTPAQSKWRTAVGKPLQSQYHAITFTLPLHARKMR